MPHDKKMTLKIVNSFLLVQLMIALVESSVIFRHCIEPEQIPTISYSTKNITQISKYIIPQGNDIMPGWGTLYRVDPDFIDIQYSTEYELVSKKEYISRNTHFGSEPVSTGSICPWKFVKNTDTNRIPHDLYEAKCIFGRSIGNPLHTCEKVYSYVNVLRRTHCTEGIYNYTEIVEPIASGCTAVRRPRSYDRILMHV